MFISVDQPLDLASTLYNGQAFRWRPDGGREQWHNGVIFNNIVKMRPKPGGVEFLCAPDDETALEPLVRDYLRLQDDLAAIYRRIGLDHRIREATARYRGMRVLRQDPWECLISFICSANNNIRRISANVEDLSNGFGRPIELEGHTRSSFPTAEELAEAGEQRLRQLGLGFRARYVASTASAVADRSIDLYALREASYDEGLEALIALPGVGDKIANCVLLFSLDRLEAFPVDVWIHRALQEWYLDGTGMKPDNKPSRAAMRAWAQDYFGPYAGYANVYLFHDRRLRGSGERLAGA